jgi:hypothetical protein
MARRLIPDANIQLLLNESLTPVCAKDRNEAIDPSHDGLQIDNFAPITQKVRTDTDEDTL